MRAQQARDQLLEMCRRSAGHVVTSAEAMTMLGPMGKRVIAEAGRIDEVQRKAAKKVAKRAARESLRLAASRQILESLTAAQAPAAQAPVAPAAAAPAPQAGGGGLLEMGAGMKSPFWRSPGAVAEGAVAETATAPEPAKPLHEMNVAEFRTHASAAFGDYGRAAGHASPIWKQQ